MKEQINTHDDYWLWLCNIENIRQPDIQKLMDVFGTPEEIFKASEPAVSELLKPEQVEPFMLSRSGEHLWKIKSVLERDHIRFIHPDSPEYPGRLKVLKDMPFSLYVKGELPDDSLPSVAIVGARACSEYGRKYARDAAAKMAYEDVQVVSGLALGIDSVCAEEVLRAGGKTFAVLGSGVDVIYPRDNISLYYEIIMNGGGIISEYPLGTRPIGWQFPHRNRLISALGDAVLIMEARMRSGTLSTAGHALDQGKDIFALPGRVGDSLSEGCNMLIQDGAGILIDMERVLSAVRYNHKNLYYEGGEIKEINSEADKITETENEQKRTFKQKNECEQKRELKQKTESEHKKELKQKQKRDFTQKKDFTQKRDFTKKKEELKTDNFTEESTDRTVYRALEITPLGVWDIAAITGLSESKVSISLARLELSGAAREVSADYYIRA
ncbi:MAG: DNA-protecting protein DprA [Parasporobacterium sp.]|nr:DNA-protecting protein DprA [Parasporobacterium sp.]